MNKKVPFLLLAVASLAACAKTKLLYNGSEYNSPIFDKNYYTDWSDIKSLDLASDTKGNYSYLTSSGDDEIRIGDNVIEGYTWDGLKENQFGYNNNLSKTQKTFSYGITSKLFDGRVRCEQLYQKSRVQLDKTGFAMYFPKTSLISAKYLGFACRGGTDFPSGQEFKQSSFMMDFTWSFYKHNGSKYDKVTYELKNVGVPIDNGGDTFFVNFSPFMSESFDELNGSVAMSFEWKCSDDLAQNALLEERNLSDDYKSEKHHLALMLYEIFIGESTWYK